MMRERRLSYSKNQAKFKGRLDSKRFPISSVNHAHSLLGPINLPRKEVTMETRRATSKDEMVRKVCEFVATTGQSITICECPEFREMLVAAKSAPTISR